MKNKSINGIIRMFHNKLRERKIENQITQKNSKI